MTLAERLSEFVRAAFTGVWGDEHHHHRFVQAYDVERSRIEARKKSYATTEQSLADGSIMVEIEVGGQA